MIGAGYVGLVSGAWEGMAEARKLMPELASCDDPYAAMTGADAVVILTEWNSYRALDLARMKAALMQPVMVDLRNIYRPAEIRAAGFTYSSIGPAPRQPDRPGAWYRGRVRPGPGAGSGTPGP